MTVLFVAGLTDSVDEALLDEWFSLHGDVHRTQVIRNQNTGRGLGYGFVEMLDRKAAEKAIGTLKGCEWEGRTLDVKLTGDQRRRIPDSPSPEAYYRDLYVSAIEYSASVDELRDLFSRVADVRDVRLVQTAAGIPSGCAFVTVGNAEHAQRAVAELNGSQFLGRTLRVDFARRAV